MKKYTIHIGLFILSLIGTTLAGLELTIGKSIFMGLENISGSDWSLALQYSIPLLTILTFHEFGHYFTARYYGINVTLPFYIPLWLGFLGAMSFGTAGAVIRIKEIIHSRRQYFDIGVAGPIAGWVIAILVIWYGFANLPDPEFIFEIHPEYKEYGLNYADHVYDNDDVPVIQIGSTITFWFFENFVVQDTSLIPHPNEMIHYPWLMAGFLALIITALNMLPIGQLDGGHVIFGLFGNRVHRVVAPAAFLLLLFYAGLGLFHPVDLFNPEQSFYLLFYLGILYISLRRVAGNLKDTFMIMFGIFALQLSLVSVFPTVEGYSGWLLFALLLGRFLGVYHPQTYDNRPLTTKQKVLGWFSLFIFVISVSPKPLIILNM
ncbi:MAG: site-2 protease family protein [Cyclobacteriaceae bacterium]|nr:site-2 protease family protein [Cyclobacteriaceae bacterium]